MEAKLREYRAQRRRRELIEKGKNILSLIKKKMTKEPQHEKLIEIESEEEVLLEEPVYNLVEDEVLEDIIPPDSEIEPLNIKRWAIIITIWLVFFIIFVKLEFGAVYFVISTIIGVCLNTTTRPRRKGEKSAYSVFNRNCERIDGSLKPEDLQKQYMFGGLGLF